MTLSCFNKHYKNKLMVMVKNGTGSAQQESRKEHQQVLIKIVNIHSEISNHTKPKNDSHSHQYYKINYMRFYSFIII